jgi:hypothetical protein
LRGGRGVRICGKCSCGRLFLLLALLGARRCLLLALLGTRRLCDFLLTLLLLLLAPVALEQRLVQLLKL